MKSRKIVITGGPGTGKTSVIKVLEQKNYLCLHEISREITREAQKKGFSQYFLEQPLLFSELLLEGRIKQFKDAEKFTSEITFLDRGIPDVVAYMDYFGNEYPEVFTEVCKKYVYERVFILPPWKDIYTSDNERYETYEEAVKIHDFVVESYKRSGYDAIEVPLGNLKERTSFILNHLD